LPTATLTLRDLAEEIRLFSDSRKSRLPWLKMATFGEARSKTTACAPTPMCKKSLAWRSTTTPAP
jgi:hypothetical protein